MSRSPRSARLTSCVRFLAGVLAVGFFAFAGAHAFAQTGLQSGSFQQLGATGGLSTTPLPIIIAQIIRAVLGVMGIVLTVLIVWAGFMYMTAGGDAEKTIRAKNIIKNAAIGLAIALSAFTITQFILSSLQSSLGLGGIGGQSAAARYQEPLAGALNGKVIQDTYPERDATDVVRNTMIIVTFADEINPASIILGYKTDGSVTALNTSNVVIAPSDSANGPALTSTQVRVFDSVMTDPGTNQKHSVFTFKPTDLLGSGAKNVDYTVTLKTGIQNAKLAPIFGNGSPGYAWTFQVSTKVDLTPPFVQSVVPVAASEQARNVTVEITFSEAMDPTTASGSYAAGQAGKTFNNIVVRHQDAGQTGTGTPVNGSFTISNGYRTVDFTTDVVCAHDNCGDAIYCLPSTQTISVQAKAASVCAPTDTNCLAQNSGSPPQARIINGGVDGLTDAAGNSLDAGEKGGLGDGKADGSPADDYLWNFTTNDAIDSRTPALASIGPPIKNALTDPTAPVVFTFNMPMKTDTLTNSNIQLWPDPYYAAWFLARSIGLDAAGKPLTSAGSVSQTQTTLEHPPLVKYDATANTGWNYYPIVTNGVRGNNQFCFFPAMGPGYDSTTRTMTADCGTKISTGPTDLGLPFCCNGQPSVSACTTLSSPPVVLPLSP